MHPWLDRVPKKWGKEEQPPQQILQHHGPVPGKPNEFIAGARELIYHFNGIIRLQAVLKIITNHTAPAPDPLTNQSTPMRNTTFHHGMGSDSLSAEE